MGLLDSAKAYLGLGSSGSSTSTSGTITRTGGSSSGGWHCYGLAAVLRQQRKVHPTPAATDRFGRRVCSPDPYGQPGSDRHTVRNFGGPYRDGDGAPDDAHLRGPQFHRRRPEAQAGTGPAWRADEGRPVLEVQQEKQTGQAFLFLIWSRNPTQPEPAPQAAPQGSGTQRAS
ncbi:hypothetical protein ACIQF6_28520 [Kitasatospora sp. NPDC092948]|uniref:hypothetical protein n=1 Tax=Kitasatospora sp. NPDC092948 TaxID=3364088 RepID=UPI00380DFFB7